MTIASLRNIFTYWWTHAFDAQW